MLQAARKNAPYALILLCQTFKCFSLPSKPLQFDVPFNVCFDWSFVWSIKLWPKIVKNENWLPLRTVSLVLRIQFLHVCFVLIRKFLTDSPNVGHACKKRLLPVYRSQEEEELVLSGSGTFNLYISICFMNWDTSVYCR